MWYDKYQIGNGTPVSEDASYPIYRSYTDECEIVITREVYDDITQVKKYKIFQESKDLSDIEFTPKNVLPQTTTTYYFAHLDVKIPRNS